jgi:negative regulator of replication initiation
MAPESRVIRVEEDVYKALQKHAKPLEDTPSSVIRRLIEQVEAFSSEEDESPEPNGARSSKRSAVRSPERTPQRDFRRPILEALVGMGGRSPAEAVLTQVHERMKRRLSKFDFTSISTGEERWRVYARWERKNMELDGLITGPRGVWEITDKGRRFVSGSNGGV